MKKDYLEELENDEVIMEIYYKFYMNVVTAIINNVDGLSKISEAQQRQYIKKTAKEIFDKTNNEIIKMNNEIKKDIGVKYKKAANAKMNTMTEVYEYKKVPKIMTKTQLDIVGNAASKAFKEVKKMNKQLPNKAKKDYVKTVNKYSKELAKGKLTFDEALKKATEDVRKKGIRMSYTRSDGIKVNVEPDVAVRRNLMGNMSEASYRISEDVAKELEADGAETTITNNARPSHQVWQGRQFVLGSVGKVIDGHYYEPFDRYKDELHDYNCGHDWSPVILGVSTPVYTEKQLNRINDRMVTYKGKKISSYDGTQIQRRLENQIRNQKRNIEALERTGQDATKEKALLQKYYKKYREASSEMGLDRRPERLKTF